MSDYPVIADVGKTLRTLLWDHMQADSHITPDIIGSKNEITLSSPDELEAESARKLSLYLYRIIENPFLKNQELPGNDPQKINGTPLTVDLLYLVTPETGDIEKDQILLGKVMQVFHDFAVVRGSVFEGDALKGTTGQLRLQFYSLPLEEIVNLWQSFSKKSFKLSVCYQVTPVRIDSTLEIEAKRVVEKQGQYYQKSVEKVE